MRPLIRALGVFDAHRTPCGVNVSVREAFALGALLQADEGAPLSQRDLQAVLGVDKSNVTRLVQQLVSSGLTEQRAGDDGRVRTLHLTPKGRKLALRIEESSAQRFLAVLGKIPRGERSNVVRAIELLRGALEDVAMEESP
jgi:DNA-binding MarR family transcriptional regulator